MRNWRKGMRYGAKKDESSDANASMTFSEEARWRVGIAARIEGKASRSLEEQPAIEKKK
jgi:hypothetical protein